ncbi:MAG TPA: flagellar export chaperone FliS [Actinomycetales bacterium]|nr:flagellar export chaperone FliS [Actinomycetales bacterium]
MSLPMATTYQRAAGRYADDSVATASPARLLVLLYDRLVLDLARGEHAQRAGDRSLAASSLGHAQEILAELLSSLDQGAWDGGPRLAAVYTWLLKEVSGAVVSGDAERTAECRRCVEPLRDAWSTAATETTASQPVLTGATA